MKLIDSSILDKWAIENEESESSHVKPASDFCAEVIEFFHGDKKLSGNPLPWHKLQFNFDLRPHEVTLWLGYNGHGKSLLLGQAMLSMMSQGQKCLIASMEMRPAATMARMCRQASQGENPALDFISLFHKWTDDRLWIYDQHGTVPPGRVLNLCRYAAKELGVHHIVIDSLMKVIHDEEDSGKIKGFVDTLCCLARDTGVHIHLVHHSRKGINEETPPGKMDARGTAAITDLVDNCVTVWRNKAKADTDAKGLPPKLDCDALIKVDKQRHGEWEGAAGLYFHKASMQFLNTPKSFPMEFMG